jgi:hypothetical protein
MKNDNDPERKKFPAISANRLGCRSAMDWKRTDYPPVYSRFE